jgi:hypothetical protein
MKKHILSILLCSVFCFLAQAQESSADSPNYDKFVGGYVSFVGGKSASPRYYFNDRFSISSSDEGNGFSIYLTPTFGKQLNSKTLVGISPFFAYSKSTDSNSSLKEYVSKGIEYGVGLFLRQNIKTMGNFSILLEPSVHWRCGHISRNSVIFPVYESRYNQLDMKISPMFAYQMNRRFRCISRLGSLGYTYEKSEYKGTTTWNDPTNSSYFNLDFGLRNIYFGIEFLF